MMREIKKWMSVWLCLFLSIQGVWSESESSEHQAHREELSQPLAYVSLVALGPRPARRFKVPRSGKVNANSSGIPIPLDPREGTEPPRSLYLKDGESWRRCSLGFNRSGGVLKVPSAESLSFYQRGKSPDGKEAVFQSYLRLPKLNPASQWIVFLEPQRGRGMGKRIWKKEPSVSVLRLNSKPMKDKNVLFRNGSSVAIVFYWKEGAPHVLKSGRRVSFKLPPKKGGYRVRAELGGKKKMLLFNSTIKVSHECLTVVAFYDESSKNHAGKPVGVSRMSVRRLSAEALNALEKRPEAK